jgi:hypothetical protein
MAPAQVETPAEQLDPVHVLQTQNTEQRRELVRKVGIERLLAHLPHSCLDQQDSYTLLDICLSEEVPHARYLKMRNPSIGVWHVEGVHPDCKTVQEALNWRASGDRVSDWHPQQLT